ncbi:hypothetical protein L2E82_35629 [Cichorium intybus]|uniref:Uncharacterized protein n=1 Tax=Cichorium intybus TaxID=13427 RepID=A0ACB9BPB1_CICIN|nr:hypothetical protein L2E82_35629 [Cichorium intybus]
MPPSLIFLIFVVVSLALGLGLPTVMHFSVKIRASNKSFFCSFIYAHNNHILRRTLWDSLAAHKHVVKVAPWIVLGDFNVALDMEDSTAGAYGISRGMDDFRDCVNRIEMEDLNFKGLFYTWTKSPNGFGGILKKIDRVLGNPCFVASFPSASITFLPYRSSDHSPTVLSLPLRSCSSLNPPLRKLLRFQGNIFTKVISLRTELDRVQIALDQDPFNRDLRDKQCR